MDLPGSHHKHHLMVTYNVLIHMSPPTFAAHGTIEAIQAEQQVTREEATLLHFQAIKERNRLGGPPCNACGSVHHRNPNDPRCPFNPQAVQQRERRQGDREMRALARNPAAIPRARNMTVTMYMRRFMPVSQSYTRVLSFYRLVRPELRETLLARVRVAQRALSNVIPLLHYFLTDFLLVHPHLATRTMFTQNGMYQASMIFRQTMQHGGAAGERGQLLGDLPRELVNHWATFAEQAHVEHVDPLVNLSRLASEEFKKLAPVFRQHLADRLEMRIKSFVRFRILTSQDEAPRGRVIDAIKNFVWDQFTSATPLLVRTQQQGANDNADNDDGDDDDVFPAEEDDFDLSDLDEPGSDDEQDQGQPMGAGGGGGGGGGPLQPVTVANMPAAIVNALRPLTLSILQQVAAWKPQAMGAVNITSLRRSPHLTVPVHVAILRVYDEFREAHPEGEHHIPSYTLLPMPSNRPRFLTIDSATFRSLLPVNGLPDGHPGRLAAQSNNDVPPFVNHLPLFWACFDFTELGIMSLDELQAGAALGRSFSGVMRTDGVQMHVTFRRMSGLAKPPPLKDADIAHMGLEGFSPIGVDPGRKTVVTAAYIPAEGDPGASTTDRAVRRVTLKEHQAIASEQNRQLALERRKQQPIPHQTPSQPVLTMKQVEDDVPMARTGDVATFRAHAAYKLQHHASFGEFYGEQAAKDRFAAHRGKQRAVATVANVLMNGSSKYVRHQRPRENKYRNRRHRKRKSRRRRAGRADAARLQLAQLEQHHNAMQGALAELTHQQEQIEQQQQQRRALLPPDIAAVVHQAQQNAAAVEADALAHAIQANAAEQTRVNATIENATGPPVVAEPMRFMKRQFNGSNATVPGVPLIGFGTGLVSKEHVKLRGLPVGKSTMVLKHLEERQARGLVMTIRTDEYKTSKTCCVCGAPAREPIRFNDQGQQSYALYATLVCARCQRSVGRDDVAAANMLSIVVSRATNGTRPAPLTRPAAAAPTAMAQPPAAPAVHPPAPPPTALRRPAPAEWDHPPRRSPRFL